MKRMIVLFFIAYFLIPLFHFLLQSLKDCKELAAHSESIGAAAIAIMAPCFFKV